MFWENIQHIFSCLRCDNFIRQTDGGEVAHHMDVYLSSLFQCHIWYTEYVMDDNDISDIFTVYDSLTASLRSFVRFAHPSYISLIIHISDMSLSSITYSIYIYIYINILKALWRFIICGYYIKGIKGHLRTQGSASSLLQVIFVHTVYPKKYAHGFCFAVLFCGYTLTDFPISIRLTSLALWQSNDCPSASKATLMNMDKYFMWIHYERLHNHNKAKHNKTVCIFLGIFCTCLFPRIWTHRSI